MVKKLQPSEIEALAKQDPLAFGMVYVDLLDGKKWELQNRQWMIEPYNALNPYAIDRSPIGKARRMAITKSTQAGISTMAIVKVLHFLTNYAARSAYMLPRAKDLSDFSSTRFDPIVYGSDYLRSRMGSPNSVYTKKVGDGFLFFMEGSVEPRSMPIDMLMIDEVDLCNPDHVGTAINRLDASPWKLLTYLSTPTLPMTGIDAVFETSDQREWVVPCPHCGEKQTMDWDANLRVVGSASEPKRVYYGCVKCNEEITVQDIQKGAWVPKFPSRSTDMIGYHISQMMTTEAPELYRHFRDPNQSVAEFHRKRLGRPYTFAGGSLEREDFLVNCFQEPYQPEIAHDGKSTYFMGVDQGNQLQVVVAKLEPGKRNPKIVHIEIVPFDQGFGRIGKLMNIYKVKRAVIDGDPNTHPVASLQKDFPGRVLMAFYIEGMRDRFVIKRNDKRVPTTVNIERTMGFDDMVEQIKDGWLSLPGEASSILPSVETYMDQLISIKRDIEKRRTAAGEVDVAVWRKLRADHFAHATLYMKVAIDIDKGKNFRTAVITPGITNEAQESQEEKAYSPKAETIVDITAILAEVPLEQLKEYLLKFGDKDYVMPFPMKYKYSLAVSNYEQRDVMWVIEWLIRQNR